VAIAWHDHLVRARSAATVPYGTAARAAAAYERAPVQITGVTTMFEALTALLADPEAHQFSWQNGELYIASDE